VKVARIAGDLERNRPHEQGRDVAMKPAKETEAKPPARTRAKRSAHKEAGSELQAMARQLADSNKALRFEAASGEPVPLFEMRYRIRGDEYRWGEFSGSPLIEHGQVVGVIGVGRDITGRKRAEDLLRIERDLGLAVSGAPALEETLRLCCDAALRASGMDCGAVYLVDEASGSVDLAFHEGLSPGFVKSVSHYGPDSANARLVMAGNPIYRRHQEFGVPLDEAGRQENLRAVAAIPVRCGNLVIACLNLASHTLDEVPESARTALEAIATQIGTAIARSKAEQALRESQKEITGILRTVPVVLYRAGISAGLPCLWVSENVEHLAGFTSGRFTQQPDFWASRLHPDDAARVFQAFETVREGAETSAEYRWQCADGSYRWFLDQMISVRHGASGPQEFIGAWVDITARKQVEEALQYRLQFEHLIGTISARFVGGGDFDAALQASLAEIGRFRRADRVYVFLFRENGAVMDNTHEWCAAGVSPQKDKLQNLASSTFPWWMDKLRKGETIHITDVAQLPPEAAAERAILESQDIKLSVAI